MAYDHLVVNGIMPSYDIWFCHGESFNGSTSIKENNSRQEALRGDNMRGMIHDVFGSFNQFMDDNISEREEIEANAEENAPHQSRNQPYPEVDKFEQLMKDSNEELYPGCKKFSKLSFVLHLYRIKLLFKWSNESFNALLGLLKDALPEGEKLPPSFYESKKIVEGLGLTYKKIHVCPNDCMLFRNEFAKKDVNECLICGASRWKNSSKKIPAKVLRHFPLIPRLQRLFMSSKTSKLMRWHHEKRNRDGVLRHPADSEAWKAFDIRHLEFAKDSRNVRLGLASDGFNPFGTMQSVYSVWPVILMPYNLPPWLCMKQELFILSLLIPGPKGPGNNIDVFLEPLIEELNDLWSVGVETYDAFSKETFQLRAALMWTINDFPAYGSLSGWCTNGQFACPCCNISTQSKRLKHGKKFCFMGHRRFLKLGHKYRSDAKSFDGTKELRSAPSPISGSQVLNQVKGIKFTFGQLNKKASGVMKNTWKKKSIFFNLPYWEYNLVRHNLDVMHIEKNVCDNLIYTLLDLGKKSKDNVEARLDLEEMNIRPALWPQQRANGRIEHISEIKRLHRKRRLTQHQLNRLHFENFHEWFKEQVKELDLTSNISNDVKALAQGPCFFAKRFNAFHMNNGYRFRTKQSKEFMQTQNSGVMVVSMTESYASTSDNAPKSGNITYYGRLNDIVELNYYEEFKVVLFKCDWVDVTQGRGVMKDDLGFTLVNFSRLIHSGERESDEPFVFAGQAQQVIFVQDPEDHEWYVPRSIKPRDIFDMGEENSMRFDSSMQSDTTDLTILENICDLEHDNNDWVRGGVDGIEIDMG